MPIDKNTYVDFQKTKHGKFNLNREIIKKFQTSKNYLKIPQGYLNQQLRTYEFCFSLRTNTLAQVAIFSPFGMQL